MTYGRHSKGQRDPAPAPREIRSIETFGRRDDPADTPRQHGDGDDPRYPSPRRLRRACAFLVDWLIHAGPMIAVFVVFAHNPALSARQPHTALLALLSWPLLSFIDRTIVQRVFHATIGKALFGLVVIRPQDGGWPTFGRLVKTWLHGFVAWIILIISIVSIFGPGGGEYGLDLDFALTAVRRKDVRNRQHIS